MKNSKEIINTKNYRSYPINNGKNNDFTCNKKTLDQVTDQIENMVINHNKVLNVRIDIRNDRDSIRKITRNDMTRIIEKAKRTIDRKYKNSPNKPDMHTTWTTENDGDNPHYHLLVTVNGNTIQNGHAVRNAFNEVVKNYFNTDKQGLVNFSKSNEKYGKMIDRNFSEFHKQFDDVIYAASYLAKNNTKEYKEKGARISSTSRLPVNWKDNPKYQEFLKDREEYAKSRSNRENDGKE